MRYAYCRNDFRIRDYCIWMPLPVLLDAPYRSLTLRSCLLYAYLLHAQTAMGKTDEKGYRCVSFRKKDLAYILRCSDSEAEDALAELSGRKTGLIRVEETDGERLLIYAKNYNKPILPPSVKRRYGYSN